MNREDAVRNAVRLAAAQLRVDNGRISDVEMRRVDLNLGFYEHIGGREPLRRAGTESPARVTGAIVFAALVRSLPEGLGTATEDHRLGDGGSEPLKTTLAGSACWLAASTAKHALIPWHLPRPRDGRHGLALGGPEGP